MGISDRGLDSCGLGWSLCSGNGQSGCVEYGGVLELAKNFSRKNMLHGVNTDRLFFFYYFFLFFFF